MSIITHSNGATKKVKNLGWLLRNWRKIESFCFDYLPSKKTVCDGNLIALLNDGSIYSTDFASFDVCVRFLNRSIFKGRQIQINNKILGTVSSYAIGSSEYLEFMKGSPEKKI